ncbi:MAG: hypothetical protein ACYSR8_09670 [Planctomycetota bacterium]
MPVISDAVSAEALTKHTTIVRSYEIPKGKFRGAIHPLRGQEYFSIWNIENNREVFYDIPSPQEFQGFDKDVTDEWAIHLQEIKGFMAIYQATRKDGAISLEFKLPAKKRPYVIYVLRMNKGQELIVFADLSETVIDKGLFGYICVCKESDALCDIKATGELTIKRTKLP